MKKCLIAIISGLILVLSASSIYAKQDIMIYENPTETSKVLYKIDANNCKKLIKIYRQKEWLKVGNSDNGQVGWINTKKCEELKDEMNRTTVKSIVINLTDKTDENGKTKIIAYKNGEQLSEKEAKELFDEFQSQQINIRKHFMKMHKEMLKMFKEWMQMWNLDDKDFDDDWMMSPKHMRKMMHQQ